MRVNGARMELGLYANRTDLCTSRVGVKVHIGPPKPEVVDSNPARHAGSNDSRSRQRSVLLPTLALARLRATRKVGVLRYRRWCEFFAQQILD